MGISIIMIGIIIALIGGVFIIIDAVFTGTILDKHIRRIKLLNIGYFLVFFGLLFTAIWLICVN